MQKFSFLLRLVYKLRLAELRSAGSSLQRGFAGRGSVLAETVTGSCYPRRDQNPTRWLCALDPLLLLRKICYPTHAGGKELMAISRNTTVVAIAALSIALAITGFRLETNRALAAAPPQGPMGNSAFLGAWCAQGDPTSTAPSAATESFSTSPMRMATRRPVTLLGCRRTLSAPTSGILCKER